MTHSMTRKLLALIAALALALTLPLGALADYAAPGTWPITTEPKEITVMVANSDIENSFADFYMTQWYEEKTGVHVNWIDTAHDSFVEKMNLALASGDPIDFITALNNTSTRVTTSQVQKYADQGLILGLNELIDNYAPNMKAALESRDGWRESITLSDGEMYTMPYLNECFHCTYYGKMWVNTVWLDNLGLAIPTTTEEFADMLRAFRDQDANGNGDPSDEIPFTGAIDAYHCKVDTYLMSAFIYDDGENRLMVNDDKQIVAVYTDPLFKEGLEYIHGLYEEGLIYPDSFTQTRSDRNAINGQKYESLFGAMPNCHHGIGGGRDTDAGEPARWLEYQPIKPLVGPNGLQTTRVNYYDNFGLGFLTSFIPATCTDPELVIRWLDLLFTEEGRQMQYLGEYGYSWTDPDEGALGVDGSAATYKTITLAQDDPYYGKMNWGQVFPQYLTKELRSGSQMPAMDTPDGSGLEAYLYYYTAENYEPYGIAIENVVPPLYFSEDVVSDAARVQTDINTYVEECIAKFITGEMDIESGWDSFQEQLKVIGLDEYLGYMQAAYEASAYYNAD